MATKRINVSLPIELAEFLKNNPELSPSKMFQAKCRDVKDTKIQAESRLKVVEIKMQEANEFIIRKELWGEFNKWKREK